MSRQGFSVFQPDKLNGLPTNKLIRSIFLVVLLGAVLRGMAGMPAVKNWVDQQLLWLQRVPVILYYLDGPSGQLVPISRSLAGNKEIPAALFAEYISGPLAGSGLTALVPEKTSLLQYSQSDGRLTLELSEHFLQTNQARAVPALWHTMNSIPGVEQVSLNVNGKLLPTPSADVRLLHFYSLARERLVSVPMVSSGHLDALNAYLHGFTGEGIVGLPIDVKILDYQFDEVRNSLWLNFSYPPSLKKFGVERPNVTRPLLTGLIATLTQFPEIDTVTLSFNGRSRLGLGQCASLIGTPQSQPAVLNDERLLKL